MLNYSKHTGFLLAALFAATSAFAAEPERGTVIRETPLYVSPDASSQRVGIATRGRDIPLIKERSVIDGKPWALILATVEASELNSKEITGWVESRLLVTTATPNGDQVIFGEAVDSERQAEERGGRR